MGASVGLYTNSNKYAMGSMHESTTLWTETVWLSSLGNVSVMPSNSMRTSVAQCNACQSICIACLIAACKVSAHLFPTFVGFYSVVVVVVAAAAVVVRSKKTR